METRKYVVTGHNVEGFTTTVLIQNVSNITNISIHQASPSRRTINRSGIRDIMTAEEQHQLPLEIRPTIGYLLCALEHKPSFCETNEGCRPTQVII
jgi:hypothetical protein